MACARRFIEEFGSDYVKAEPLRAGAKLTVKKVVLGTDDLDNVRVWVHLEDDAGSHDFRVQSVEIVAAEAGAIPDAVVSRDGEGLRVGE
jgi:hypothetical protein